MAATIVVLLIFTFLTIAGMGESAIVAVIIFLVHIASLTILVIAGIWFIANTGFETMHLNWALPVKSGGILTALFLGFSAAMLGISGFESSANFVEEQEQGVFPKTLRNMWAVVSFFNPLIALIIIFVLPLASVGENQEALLAYMGEITGGKWLAYLISVDAVLVLCGAVLTSFVGVSGLVNRMTLDRILPNYFLKQNKRGAHYRIAIAFLLLCVSVLIATNGVMTSLAGVYTFSFLSVMALFGIGNLLLKIKRKRLPRPEYAPVLGVLIAISFIILGFWGNLILNPSSFSTFLYYLIPAFLVVLFMLNRSVIISALLVGIDSIFRPLRKFSVISNRKLRNMYHQIHSQEFVFFTKRDDVSILNKVMQYVEENETTKKIKIVNVMKPGEDNEKLKVDIEVLDRAYPMIDIEFIEITGEFTPDLIEKLSKEWGIPKNFMFIASPSDRFSYRVADLGGVRLIM
jgi:amino acid transporter